MGISDKCWKFKRNWTISFRVAEIWSISNLYHNDNTVLMIINIKLCLQEGVTLDT